MFPFWTLDTDTGQAFPLRSDGMGGPLDGDHQANNDRIVVIISYSVRMNRV